MLHKHVFTSNDHLVVIQKCTKLCFNFRWMINRILVNQEHVIDSQLNLTLTVLRIKLLKIIQFD